MIAISSHSYSLTAASLPQTSLTTWCPHLTQQEYVETVEPYTEFTGGELEVPAFFSNYLYHDQLVYLTVCRTIRVLSSRRRLGPNLPNV